MFEVLENIGDLDCKLSRGSEHDGEKVTVAALEVAAVAELLDEGEGEGQGLSRASQVPRYKVVAIVDELEGARLDWEERYDALRLQLVDGLLLDGWVGREATFVLFVDHHAIGELVLFFFVSSAFRVYMGETRVCTFRWGVKGAFLASMGHEAGGVSFVEVISHMSRFIKA